MQWSPPRGTHNLPSSTTLLTTSDNCTEGVVVVCVGVRGAYEEQEDEEEEDEEEEEQEEEDEEEEDEKEEDGKKR